jgi:crotonobetainyl-CoA:carnitine CoA-transferase CaiB-like acyl-CoA transferase
MARSGFMFNTPDADGAPVYPTGALSDILSGTMLGFGVMAALLARERTGVSQSVWASQLSTMMWLQYYNVAQYTNVGEDFAPYDRHDVANPLMNLYRCADERWIACGLFVAPRFWSDFCQVLGLADIEHDPRFSSDEKRAENRKELISRIEGAFATQPRDYWENIFREKGFWFSVVNKVSDLPDDPQVAANDYLMELDNGLKTVSAPFSLEKTPPLRKARQTLASTPMRFSSRCVAIRWRRSLPSRRRASPGSRARDQTPKKRAALSPKILLIETSGRRARAARALSTGRTKPSACG